MSPDLKEKWDIVMNDLRFQNECLADVLDSRPVNVSEVKYRTSSITDIDKRIDNLLEEFLSAIKRKEIER